jgi:hypothetical protein
MRHCLFRIGAGALLGWAQPSLACNSGIDRDDPLDLGLDWKPTEPPR